MGSSEPTVSPAHAGGTQIFCIKSRQSFAPSPSDTFCRIKAKGTIPTMCCCDCLLVLIALIFPPFPVIVKCGLCSPELLINIALCVLGYVPGVLHAFYIIAKYPIRYVVIDEESQVYRVVHDGSSHRATPPPVAQISAPQQYYGSMNNNVTESLPPPYTEMAGSSTQQRSQPPRPSPAPSGKN